MIEVREYARFYATKRTLHHFTKYASTNAGSGFVETCIKSRINNVQIKNEKTLM